MKRWMTHVTLGVMMMMMMMIIIQCHDTSQFYIQYIYTHISSFNGYHPQDKLRTLFIRTDVPDVHHDSQPVLSPTLTLPPVLHAIRVAHRQELDQARPAEEIWLDALITVLEEASSCEWSGGLVLFGGDGDLFSFETERDEMVGDPCKFMLLYTYISGSSKKTTDRLILSGNSRNTIIIL